MSNIYRLNPLILNQIIVFFNTISIIMLLIIVLTTLCCNLFLTNSNELTYIKYNLISLEFKFKTTNCNNTTMITIKNYNLYLIFK